MKRKATKAAPKKRERLKPDWAPRFLICLAVSGNVSDAAQRAGVNRCSYYKRRQTDDAFLASVKDAFAQSTDGLELEALRRAKDGVTKPLIYKGKPIFVWTDKDGNLLPSKKGSVGPQRALMEHEYSDLLMIFILKSRRPNKYRDRQRIEHTGKGGKPIQYQELSDAELDRKIAEAESRLRIAAGRKDSPPALTGTSEPVQK